MAALRSARRRGSRSASTPPAQGRGEERTGRRCRWQAARAAVEEGVGASCFIFVGLEAAALKPGINPGGNIRPQPGLHGEQGVDFEAGQLPTLLSELRKR